MISLVEALKEDRDVIIQKQIEMHHSVLFATRDPKEDRGPQNPGLLPLNSVDISREVDDLVVKCLLCAASQWAVPEPKEPLEEHRPWERAPALPLEMPPNIRHFSVERILKVVDLAYRVGNKTEEVCKHLLIDILNSPGSTGVKFVELYIPLMQPLRALLQQRNQTVLSHPFIEFFRSIICKYLSDILGRRTEARDHRLRQIGCGCRDCKILDRFILDPSAEEEMYAMPKARRLHLEHMLSFSPDLCTFETLATRPCHSIKVKKLPEVVLASTWEERDGEAREFLRSIGTDEEVSIIMGDRYRDVMDALEGIRPFVETDVA